MIVFIYLIEVTLTHFLIVCMFDKLEKDIFTCAFHNNSDGIGYLIMEKELTSKLDSSSIEFERVIVWDNFYCLCDIFRSCHATIIILILVFVHLYYFFMLRLRFFFTVLFWINKLWIPKLKCSYTYVFFLYVIQKHIQNNVLMSYLVK